MEHPVVDPVFGMRSRFWRERDAEGQEVQHIETVLEHGGGVTPHIHPAMEERFTVLDGRMEFLSGRRWIEAGPVRVRHQDVERHLKDAQQVNR